VETVRDVGSSGDSEGPDMSEHWQEYGSEQPVGEFEAARSSSTNGVDPEDTVGVTDGSAHGVLADHHETTDESPAAVEITGEASVAEAAEDVVAAPHEAPDGDDETAAASDDGSVFLGELVRAMQKTAGLERVRIGEDTERRRQAHIGRVRAREASEAERMRELAGEDMKAIEAWTDGETKRIQLERDRRATALQEDLETSLAEHRSKVEREIEGVETAIATYRADLDTFFEGFDRQTDLVLIAQEAAKRPVFPTLDGASESIGNPSVAAVEAVPSSLSASPTRADSGTTGAGTAGEGPAVTSETVMIGVMDPQAATEPVESWNAPPETKPQPVLVVVSNEIDRPGEAGEPAEPVAVATGSNPGGAGSLLQSVPVLRPMSWLRRDMNGGDRPNRDG
jgi:hypothetical protein